jgi:hypothetical protein
MEEIFDENFLENKDGERPKYNLKEYLSSNIDICEKEKKFYLENCNFGKKNTFCDRLENVLITCLQRHNII